MLASESARRPGRTAAVLLLLALLAAAVFAAARARAQTLVSVYNQGPGDGPFYFGNALTLTNFMEITLPNDNVDRQGHLSWFFAVTIDASDPNERERATCEQHIYSLVGEPTQFLLANRIGAGSGAYRGREITITTFNEVFRTANSRQAQDYVRIYSEESPQPGVHTVTIRIEGKDRIPTSAHTHPCPSTPGTVNWTITVAVDPARPTLGSVFHRGPGDGPFYYGEALTLTSLAHMSWFFMVGRRSVCGEHAYSIVSGPNQFSLADRFSGGNLIKRGREITIDLNNQVGDRDVDNDGNKQLQDYVRIYADSNPPRGVHTLSIEIDGADVISANDRPCPDSMPGTVSWTITISDRYEEQGHHSDEATAILDADELLTATAGTYTGLRYNRSFAGCREIDVSLAAGAPDYLELIRYRGDVPSPVTSLGPISMEEGEDDNDSARLYVKAGVDVATGGTLTIQVAGKANSSQCSGLQDSAPDVVTWNLTIEGSDWLLQGADRNAASGAFSPVLVARADAPTDTGLAFHRRPATCTQVDVTLTGAPAYLELVRYGADGRPAAGGLSGIHMEKDHADDNHVRLFFREGEAPAAGTTVEMDLVASGAASCDQGALPMPLTLGWKLTIGTPAEWETLPRDNTQYGPIHIDEINEGASSRAYRLVGAAFQRNVDSCPQVDVELRNHADIFGLVSDRAFRGGGYEASHLNESIEGMEMADAGSDYAHIVLRTSYRRHVEGTLTVTLVAAASSGCTDPGHPRPLTLAYEVVMYENLSSWKDGPAAASAADRVFGMLQLRQEREPIDTGIKVQRTSDACHSVDVTLLGPKDRFELYRYLGTVRAPASAPNASALEGVPMRPTGTSDHVRLFFKARALAAVGTVEVTVAAAANMACGDPRTPTVASTMTFQVTVVAAAWRTLSQNALTPQASFGYDALTGSVPTETGVRLHYGSLACRHTDVALARGADFFELAAHRADGAMEGAAAARLEAVRMEEGAAADRHVRLRFKAGARPPVGAVVAAVRIAANEDRCAAAGDLGAFTLSFTVMAFDDLDDPPAIELSAAEASLLPGVVPREAAVGVSARADDDDDDDVVITLRGRTAAGEDVNDFFRLALAGGAYELRVRRRVSLVAGAVYPVVFVATDDVIANRGVRTAEATAMIQVLGKGTEAAPAAALNAGGAAARAIGIGSIDAVLDRPADVGDGAAGLALLEMLAAKEQELESGEIDLREFLAGQSLALPLNAADGGGGPVGVWFQAASMQVGGEADDVYTEGDVFSSRFGVDARLGSLLLGASYGLHDATSTYAYDAEREEILGEYELQLQLLQPYLSLDVAGMRLAVAASAGAGEMTVAPEGDPAIEHDVDYLGYSLGLVQRLQVFGAGELRMRGSYASGELDVDQPEDAAGMDAESGSLRLALAYAHSIGFGSDSSFSPFLEAGYLSLWGDGDIGNSYLVAGGLEYAGGPLRASASYQEALGDDVTMGGFELSFRFNPQAGGLGLGLDANPGYGLTGTEKMLAELGAGRALALDGGGLRGGAGVSYGLAVDGGLLTPYGRWSAGAGRELGLRLRAGTRRSWALGYGAAANELKIEYRLGD